MTRKIIYNVALVATLAGKQVCRTSGSSEANLCCYSYCHDFDKHYNTTVDQLE